MSDGDPTLQRAAAVLEASPPVEDLTGVELLALFELKCVGVRQQANAGELGPTAGRAVSLAITYGQEARQRYTEALAQLRGTHNPVDLEALDRAGVSAEDERRRFENDNRSKGQ